jgi:hypothetical protein
VQLVQDDMPLLRQLVQPLVDRLEALVAALVEPRDCDERLLPWGAQRRVVADRAATLSLATDLRSTVSALAGTLDVNDLQSTTDVDPRCRS